MWTCGCLALFPCAVPTLGWASSNWSGFTLDLTSVDACIGLGPIQLYSDPEGGFSIMVRSLRVLTGRLAARCHRWSYTKKCGSTQFFCFFQHVQFCLVVVHGDA